MVCWFLLFMWGKNPTDQLIFYFEIKRKARRNNTKTRNKIILSILKAQQRKSSNFVTYEITIPEYIVKQNESGYDP